jgi:hypothetical protein
VIVFAALHRQKSKTTPLAHIIKGIETMDATSVLIFLGAALLLNISPGPDLLYVMSTAMKN